MKILACLWHGALQLALWLSGMVPRDVRREVLVALDLLVERKKCRCAGCARTEVPDAKIHGESHRVSWSDVSIGERVVHLFSTLGLCRGARVCARCSSALVILLETIPSALSPFSSDAQQRLENLFRTITNRNARTHIQAFFPRSSLTRSIHTYKALP